MAQPTPRLAFHWIARVVLGGAFIYAGARKVTDVTAFSDAIAGFRVLPSALVMPVALTFPVLEILLGVMVLLPASRLPRAGSLGLALLNLLFIAVLASAWIRGLDVNCGCFGFDWAPSSEWKLPLAIARDLVLLALAGQIWLKFVMRGLPPNERICVKNEASGTTEINK